METSTEYGCFFCGKGKTEDLSSVCSNCGHPFDISRELLAHTFGPYRPSAVLGRGFYGVVLLAKNQIGRQVALKVCSLALYHHRQKSFHEEVEAYIAVGDHPNIAELIDGGEQDIVIMGTTINSLYLVTKYIPNAINLDSFISKGELSVEDIIGISFQVCAAISRVEALGLWHNDLHGRNILLAPREDDDRDHHPTSARHVVKVVDLGSAVFRHPGPYKEIQDIQWIGKHLDRMLGAIRPHLSELSKADQWFVRQLPELIDEATEANPERRARAADLADSIERLWQKSVKYGQWQPVRLTSAFGYTNANAFPDDSYISALFSKKFPWLSHISAGEGTILLTGPRGCGKTMILRSLRLRTLIVRRSENESNKDRVERVQEADIIGFFVSARLTVGIYRSLGETPAWLETPSLSNTFFNLVFLQEIVDTFLFAQEEGLGLLTEEEIWRFAHIVLGFIEGIEGERRWAFVPYFSLLEHLARQVEDVLELLVVGKVESSQISSDLTGPGALIRIGKFLTEETRLFHQKRMLYLLDDFTQPLIPEQCQRSFLPIMFRAGEYHFIVSAHSKSVSLEDLSGVRYDPSREFREINLGREYVGALEHAIICEDFLNDILSLRFRTADVFEGNNLSDLLGRSNYIGGSVAEEIADRHINKRLRGLQFHGVDTLVQLCTGDVSSIIDLVGALLGRQDPRKPPEIPATKSRQNHVIRLYARRELMKLLDVRQFDGRRLYDIAIEFGLMSRGKILQYARDKPRGGGRAPQYLRIEIQEEVPLAASEEEALRALLQYGVFIDGGLGSSNRGTPTQVLIFRKLFTPVFPTTIVSRDSFSWTVVRLSRFLRDPKSVRFEELRRVMANQSNLEFEVAPEDLEDLERA